MKLTISYWFPWRCDGWPKAIRRPAWIEFYYQLHELSYNGEPETCIPERDWAGILHRSVSTFYRALRRLIDLGYVETWKEGANRVIRFIGVPMSPERAQESRPGSSRACPGTAGARPAPEPPGTPTKPIAVEARSSGPDVAPDDSRARPMPVPTRPRQWAAIFKRVLPVPRE